MNTPKKIFIAGAGGIGRAVALRLCDFYKDKLGITLGDINLGAAEHALRWIRSGSEAAESVQILQMPTSGSSAQMDDILQSCQIVLDCLPGTQAPRIARLAKQFNLHYVNLTEYVKEKISQEEMIQLIETKSWQYAKRQMTWLKRNKEIVWVQLEDTVKVKNELHKFLQA